MTSAVVETMPRRDFFSFCTTLRPIELKALGELSHVRHLQKGELIYKSGDVADEIYSVNRGVVELTQLVPGESDERNFVGRGDVFGLAATLGNMPRSHSATAQEVVSLQCFTRQNFGAISQHVPSFLLFLCEQMAHRVQQMNAGKGIDGCQQLSGSLANFDLITVHQTIISSGQTGELCVLNENGERLATFYFEDGAPTRGQFQHLFGEEAFWQLFLCDDLPGSFSFSSGVHPMTACVQAADINQSPNDLLIAAMRFHDELQDLKKTMPGANVPLQRLAHDFEWPKDADLKLKPLAERAWSFIENRRVTINQLFRQNAVCELKIYRVIAEMLRVGQIATVHTTPQFAKAS